MPKGCINRESWSQKDAKRMYQPGIQEQKGCQKEISTGNPGAKRMYQPGILEQKGCQKDVSTGNRTRVCTVAGYYSTTRPLIPIQLELVGRETPVKAPCSMQTF